MKKVYTFLQPTYYKEFSCSGGDCKLNCCNYNWIITIDKETYQKYRSIKAPKEFAEKLNKYVKRNRNAKDSRNYARIIQKQDKMNVTFNREENGEMKEVNKEVLTTTCIFQNEQKLCDIHINMGIEGLSHTCKIFPRLTNNVYNNLERSLNIGCEEVSKLLLKHKDGIRFETLKEEVDDLSFNLELSTKFTPKIASYFDQIRATSISILQLNDISMDNRIILLGAFLLKIDEFYKNNLWSDIPDYINDFVNNLDVYFPLLKIDKVRHDLILERFLLQLIGVINKSGTMDIKFELINVYLKISNCFSVTTPLKLDFQELEEDANGGLFKLIEDENKNLSEEELKKELQSKYDIKEDGSVISKEYQKYKNNVEKLMEGKEYYIENMFVNIFFGMGYPTSALNGSSIKDNFIAFSWSYCFYKVMLSGYLGEQNNLDEDLLHKICTIFGRVLGLQRNRVKEVVDEFKKEGNDNIALLSILIKSS